MPDILNSSESQSVHTFLSSMDYNEPNDIRNPGNVDWNGYDMGTHGHSMPEIPQLQGREALTKATKDLMSLDPEGWNASSSMHQYQQQQQQQNSYNYMNHQSSQYGYDHRQPGLYHQQQQDDGYPYLPKQGSQSPHPPLNPVPSHLPVSSSFGPSQDPHAGSNLRSSFSSMGTSPGTASSFPYGNSNGRPTSSHSTLPSPDPSIDQSSEPSGSGSSKRSMDSMSYLPSNKRSRPSPPAPSSTKSTLLSPSQKKANHIQSEQKRRANIRRGYEALCETVPALREAIRLEEEAQQTSDSISSNGKKPKRGRRAKIDDGTGEKIDGRAGPRSENIVLGKTIDYIKDLLNDRDDLLARLERARSSLAPDHPSSQPSDPQPLWEREWKGGSGKEVDADEDDEDDEE